MARARPSSARPPRRHAAFPVALVTTGRRLLIVGGGPETADRLSAALRFDWASITLVTLAVRAPLRRRAARDARVRLVERPVREADVRAADVVIEGCGDPEVVERLAAWCRRHRRLLNAMDSPPHCDFHGVSFFARGPLLVSVASGGHAPALSAVLRRSLEAAVGPGWQTAACLMAAARGRLPSGPARRVLMKALAADADLMDAIARNDRPALRARLSRLATITARRGGGSGASRTEGGLEGPAGPRRRARGSP